MKCPSCGAETKSAKFCEYCGSELPKDTPNINITNNYYGNSNNSTESVDSGKCPKCNSNKVKFQREKIGSVGNAQSRKTVLTDTRKSNSVKQNAYRTVGICQNCGYTWDPNATENNATTKSGKGCLWWFLMLCIWPIALSVWFYKTDKVKLEKKWKIAIIAVFWIFVLVFGGSSDNTETVDNDVMVESTIQNDNSEKEETETMQTDIATEDTEDAKESIDDTVSTEVADEPVVVSEKLVNYLLAIESLDNLKQEQSKTLAEEHSLSIDMDMGWGGTSWEYYYKDSENDDCSITFFFVEPQDENFAEHLKYMKYFVTNDDGLYLYYYSSWNRDNDDDGKYGYYVGDNQFDSMSEALEYYHNIVNANMNN